MKASVEPRPVQFEIENEQNDSFYKHYKNKLNHSLRIAKRLYYEKKLDATKSNIRGTWRIRNEIVKNKKRLN